MATPVVMPKLGNSVESSIIVEWKRAVGDRVEAGDALCEVETDKALVDVESPVAGTLLARFFEEGADVPVRTTIAVIGAAGERFEDLRPPTAASIGTPIADDGEDAVGGGEDVQTSGVTVRQEPVPNGLPQEDGGPAQSRLRISPRARWLAAQHDIDISTLTGSGPQGRIIERDVDAAIASQPRLSPVARAMVEEGAFVAPDFGSGPRGRIMSRDLHPRTEEETEDEGVPTSVGSQAAGEGLHGVMRQIPVKGVRRVIADRMLASLQTTAQLTLTASADARNLLALRKRFKESAEPLQLRDVTVNALVLFAVSRVVPQFPAVNAHFDGETISQFEPVHLGFAVDTDRGLLAPVIRQAQQLSLRVLADESRRLAEAAQSGAISPEEMSGGTFTVTNLGQFGIESFTPILNPPQVAILGVGSIQLHPVPLSPDGVDPSMALGGDQVEFIPHLALSLTINHQAVDGAPAARFLQALTHGLATLDLLMAL